LDWQKNEYSKTYFIMIRVQAILIVGIFAFMLLKPAIPYIDYLVRKSYIITNFCINRDKPEMGCNGKCHLNEKLSEGNKAKDNSPAPVPQKQWKISDFLLATKVINNIMPDLSDQGFLYINNYSFQFATSVFHPPV
jgi:hypothetical protein